MQPIETLTFERAISCPPDRLWSLLTDPKHREAWGAPSDDAVLVVETADTRVDGHDRHRCGPKDAPDFVVDTRWYHMDAPTSACFTESLTIGGARIATSLVTYAVAPDGDGSRLNVAVAVASLTGEPMADDFGGGWTSALGRLEKIATDAA